MQCLPISFSSYSPFSICVEQIHSQTLTDLPNVPRYSQTHQVSLLLFFFSFGNNCSSPSGLTGGLQGLISSCHPGLSFTITMETSYDSTCIGAPNFKIPCFPMSWFISPLRWAKTKHFTS